MLEPEAANQSPRIRCGPRMDLVGFSGAVQGFKKYLNCDLNRNCRQKLRFLAFLGGLENLAILGLFSNGVNRVEWQLSTVDGEWTLQRWFLHLFL